MSKITRPVRPLAFEPLEPRALFSVAPLIAPLVDHASVPSFAPMVVSLAPAATPFAASTSSTTTLVAAPTSPTYGQAVTLTSTVSGTGSTPTGIVTFSADSISIGTATLASGIATFSVSTLTLGTHTLIGVYSGDATFLTSSSSTVTLVVAKATPTLILTASGNPVAINRTVTFFTSFSGLGANPPTGIVTYTDGTATLGTATLSNGIATWSTPLSAGTHAIGASYTGDSNFNNASGSLTQVVVDNTTTTTLTLSSATANKGQSITFTATLTSPNGVPTGSVKFMNGAALLGSGTLNGSGVATFTSTTLGVGAYSVVATYSGTVSPSGPPRFVGSSSASQLLLIGTANQRFVNQLYVDLFHRIADDFGLASWTAALDSGQTLAQVATSITSSREYDGIVVDAFYTTYLGRHAETAGLNSWVDQMQAGLNAEVIRAGILGSQEYYDDTGGDDTSYVTALYQTFLNRAPDDFGLNSWLTILADPSKRQSVASGISNSDENRTAIITTFYTTYLHRSPDQGGLDYWKGRLAGGISQPQIISAFVTSPEYLSFNHIS